MKYFKNPAIKLERKLVAKQNISLNQKKTIVNDVIEKKREAVLSVSQKYCHRLSKC